MQKQKIAILGWGSLCWDPRELMEQLIGGWSKDGPELRLEFSRVSIDRRLTLVIDYSAGKVLPTRYAQSKRTHIEDAIRDLGQREGTSAKHVGFVTKDDTKREGMDEKTVNTVKAWLTNNPDWYAMIWTNLSPNYECKTGNSFSVDEAVRYLKALPETAQNVAWEYIACAPPEVATPLRVKLKEAGWWKDSDCKHPIEEGLHLNAPSATRGTGNRCA